MAVQFLCSQFREKNKRWTIILTRNFGTIFALLQVPEHVNFIENGGGRRAIILDADLKSGIFYPSI